MNLSANQAVRRSRMIDALGKGEKIRRPEVLLLSQE